MCLARSGQVEVDVWVNGSNWGPNRGGEGVEVVVDCERGGSLTLW